MGYQLYEATDTSDGSTIYKWNQGAPSDWLSDDSIEDIHTIKEKTDREYQWYEIDRYLRQDRGYTIQEVNNLRSKYPTFHDFLLAGRIDPECKDQLNQMETDGDLTSTEVGYIKNLIGL